eukprot:TRINITY_DN14576_c0_g1_i3.p1 TRINITY_DN14576_c0_g1~~TRINITY_DN14576_c0_g1_i3.p1  ORF type:complete len:117 (-),score=33.79 TRINITY_DN14576_c0_g1_i3:226-576(-)
MFFFFKQKTAYEMQRGLVGSEMCIRDRINAEYMGFPKLNAEAMFASVDKNGDGQIQLDEWVAFWNSVKSSGHSEEEIEEELDSLKEGGTWVHWDKLPEYKKTTSKYATQKNYSWIT